MKLITDIKVDPDQLPKKRPLGERVQSTRHHTSSAKRHLNPGLAKSSSGTIKSIDGVYRRHGAAAAKQLSNITTRIEEKIELQPIIDNKRSPLIIPDRTTVRTRNFILQNTAIAIIAIVMAYSSEVGQVIIGVYLILGLLFKFDSRYSFGAALIFLIGIPFFQVIGQSGVSENSAIYAYEMLVVGVVQAIVESFRTKGSKDLTKSSEVAHE